MNNSKKQMKIWRTKIKERFSKKAAKMAHLIIGVKFVIMSKVSTLSKIVNHGNFVGVDPFIMVDTFVRVDIFVRIRTILANCKKKIQG